MLSFVLHPGCERVCMRVGASVSIRQYECAYKFQCGRVWEGMHVWGSVGVSVSVQVCDLRMPAKPGLILRV